MTKRRKRKKPKWDRAEVASELDRRSPSEEATLISQLTGTPVETIPTADVKGPCLICGGETRMSLTNQGNYYCHACGARDPIALVMELRGEDASRLPSVLDEIAQQLGLQGRADASKSARRTQTKAADKGHWSDHVTVNDKETMWLEHFAVVTDLKLNALLASGAHCISYAPFGRTPDGRAKGRDDLCIGWPVHGEGGEITGYRRRQWSNHRIGKNGERTLSTKESDAGIIGQLPNLAAVDKVIICEGETDMVAVIGALNDSAVAVVSPSNGAGQNPPVWFADELEGKEVVIIYDRDKPGDAGSRKWAKALYGKAAEVKRVELPYELKEDHGSDVRDYLRDHTSEELLGLIEATPCVAERDLLDETIGCDESDGLASESEAEACTSVFLPNGTELDFSLLRLLPMVPVPGKCTQISDSAWRFGAVLAAPAEYVVTHEDGKTIAKPEHVKDPLVYRRGRVPLTIFEGQIYELSPEELTSAVEQVSVPFGLDAEGDRVDANLSTDAARKIKASRPFIEELPKLKAVRACPIATEVDGAFDVVAGYCPKLMTYSTGEVPDIPELHDAVEMLKQLFCDFQFASPSDESRAMAAAVTPALLNGHFIPDWRTPVIITEADDSQAGKGISQQVIAAIYGEKMGQVTMPAPGSRGVQSVEEAVDSHLIDGRSFIQLDNVRGKIDYQKFESLVTEPSYTARAAYKSNVTVDPRSTTLLVTTNGAEMTRDFANRSSIIRIRKRPSDYKFRSYPEGSLVEHVRGNQANYLGAVYAIIKAWHEKGKPSNIVTGHSFRTWAGIADWIVQELFRLPPLLDGHEQALLRTTSPHLDWLRQVAFEIDRGGKSGVVLRANEIHQLLVGTNVEIPGKDGDEDNQLRALGKRMSAIFKKTPNSHVAPKSGSGVVVQIDELMVTKFIIVDGSHRKKNAYIFEIQRQSEDSPRTPPNIPQESPSKNTQSPNPPKENQLLLCNPEEEVEETVPPLHSSSAITPLADSLGDLGALGVEPEYSEGEL